MKRPTTRLAPRSPADLEDLKSQMALELRADLLAGRGKLPRDKSGRVSAAFLEQLERPRESPAERTAAAANLASLFGQIATYTPAPAELRSRVQRLEALERDLERLLSTATPHHWAQIRAPLRRLLGRARRELRAVDRAELLT